MSDDTYQAEAGKAEFEGSVLVEYGDAADLTQGPGATPGVEGPYIS